MDNIVSYDDEPLILVDPDDRIIGYKDKLSCHLNSGILHRAFSILIFNSNKELLLQKRSSTKMLWPGYWSNTCCSHPRKGESYETAVFRRLDQELGFTAPLLYLYKFQYQAPFGLIGSENELCSVYAGFYDGKILPNINEIDEWKYISIEELEHSLDTNPDTFTPWFKMEWERIQIDYVDNIKELFKE